MDWQRLHGPDGHQSSYQHRRASPNFWFIGSDWSHRTYQWVIEGRTHADDYVRDGHSRGTLPSQPSLDDRALDELTLPPAHPLGEGLVGQPEVLRDAV